MNQAMEGRRLAQADQHIAEGKARIARLSDNNREWERKGINVASARDTLKLLEATLLLMVEHRSVIVSTLAAITRPQSMSSQEFQTEIPAHRSREDQGKRLDSRLIATV